jgi:hypothetical protein
MSQDAIDDVLALDAGDDFDGLTTAIANVNVDLAYALSILHTRLSRWAQDIATCRSAGERTSVLAIGFTPVPRLAGVTSPRQRWFGASTPW